MAKLEIIKELAKQKNLTLDYIAKESGITSQGLYKMIRENSTRVDTLEKIAEVLDVPISCFFSENDSNKHEKMYPAAVKEIPYYAVDFAAGFSLLYNDQTNVPADMVRLPQFSGADCLVDVSGKSMEPLISPGDCIAIKRLDNWREMYLPGEVYAIVTDEYRTIKRVRKSEKGDAWLKLVPENPDYDPQDIKSESVLAMFTVLGSIKKIF